MLSQTYSAFEPTYAPINMGHSATVNAGSKKRKALDELESYDGGECAVRPKLGLPRSAGVVLDADARFHPLPAHVNQAMLSQLGSSPFGGCTKGSFVTPSSSYGSLSANDDYFSAPQYPAVEPYPSQTSPTASTYGILGPAPAQTSSCDGMDVDDSPAARGHGPHCKSIPQLCVRYNDGRGSELWATCPDCGACSKVDSSRPASKVCYSP